jgi:hypothetical protein
MGWYLNRCTDAVVIVVAVSVKHTFFVTCPGGGGQGADSEPEETGGTAMWPAVARAPVPVTEGVLGVPLPMMPVVVSVPFAPEGGRAIGGAAEEVPVVVGMPPHCNL